MSETRDLQEASSHATCAKASPGSDQRYRGFVTAPGTLIAAGNGRCRWWPVRRASSAAGCP